MYWLTRFEVHMRAQEKLRRYKALFSARNRETPTNRVPLGVIYFICGLVMVLLVGMVTGIQAFSVIALIAPLVFLIGGFLLVKK